MLSVSSSSSCSGSPARPGRSRPANIRVQLHTEAGDIVVELEMARAPITARNFLHYVDTRRLDGTEFYRAMHTGPDAGLIQGGVAIPGQLFPPIAHEPTTQTGLSHVDGALSAPRFAVGTARGDFTIMVGPQTYLDAGPGLGRRRARLRRVRPCRRRDGRGPPYPRRADLADRRGGGDARPDARPRIRILTARRLIGR